MLDAPVPEFFERNDLSGYAAPDEGTGPNDPNVTIEKLQLGFGREHLALFKTVHHFHYRPLKL